jgi:putative transposase
MPRRWKVDRRVCHVFNRAAAKLTLFKNPPEYRAFLHILQQTRDAFASSIKLHGYSVMPNHWHLIICPESTPRLSQFMHQLTRRHAQGYLTHHADRSGAIYQGRFRCVPIQEGAHLHTVLLYVDRNPLRAGLVARAEHWLWSSVHHHAGIDNDALLDDIPGFEFANWLQDVNAPQAADDLTRVALTKNVQLGDPSWVKGLAPEWRPAGKTPRQPGKSNRDASRVDHAAGSLFDHAD